MEEPNEVQKDKTAQEQGIEDLYGGLQNIPLKVLDLVIWGCVAALVLVIALGVLNR